MSVQEYLEKHALQKKLEDVLNLCVKEKPEEPLEFMVTTANGINTCGVCNSCATPACSPLRHQCRPPTSRS
jgi:hypothetical protein